MAKEIGENTKITLDLKTIGLIVAGIISLVGMWFALQADIEEAKELPDPEVTRMEYDLKDQMIRETIMNTQDDVTEIKQSIEKIEDKLYDNE